MAVDVSAQGYGSLSSSKWNSKATCKMESLGKVV